jgi:hypothetical protein
MPSLAKFAVLSLLTGSAFAQTLLVFPPEYERAWGRGSTSALAGNTTRTQIVLANPVPVGTLILGFGLRDATGTADGAAFTADIEVSVSSTAAVPGALSTTWTLNHGTDLATVLPRQIVNIAAMPANRSTGLFTQIQFATPFVFGLNGATNLCIDLTVFGRSAGAQWSTDRAFAATAGRATNTGIGCGAGTITSTSTGGSGAYTAGASLNVALANAPANTAALLMYSFDQKDFAPGLPLPLDLSLLGTAPGCDLMLNPSEGFTVYIADGAGAATASFVIPAGIAQVGLGLQWGYFVPPSALNPFGLEITNNRTLWIGPEIVLPNAQYVWHLSSATSATATSATTDSVPVVQLILP